MSLDSVLHMLQRVLKRAANAVGGPLRYFPALTAPNLGMGSRLESTAPQKIKTPEKCIKIAEIQRIPAVYIEIVCKAAFVMIDIFLFIK